jgi:hypothetical protein
MSWTHRLRPTTVSPELQQVRAAAQDLAQQAGHAPGRSRVIFQTVADCALLGTAVIGGALASVHLWRALFPKHKENPHDPEPAGSDHSPPRRRGPPVATAFADRHDDHEHRGQHYR